MPFPYATVDNVKNRLGITGTSEDTLLWRMCAEVNAYIETVTRRSIGSSSVTNQVISSWEHVQGGGCIIDYPPGVRSITSLEVRLTTDGSYSTVPAGDYFILPEAPYRTPGWPGFSIHLTDIPSSTNSTPTISGAFEAIRLNADIGWAAMPDDIRGVAEVAVSRALHAAKAGYGDDVGLDEWGEMTVSRFLSSHDYRTLRRYRWEPVEVI